MLLYDSPNRQALICVFWRQSSHVAPSQTPTPTHKVIVLYIHLIIPLLIQLINDPILVIRRHASCRMPIWQINLVVTLSSSSAARYTRVKDNDHHVCDKANDAGPEGVIRELAPAALVEDGALVGNAADEIDKECDCKTFAKLRQLEPQIVRNWK